MTINSCGQRTISQAFSQQSPAHHGHLWSIFPTQMLQQKQVH